jgi:hypothetical protein
MGMQEAETGGRDKGKGVPFLKYKQHHAAAFTCFWQPAIRERLVVKTQKLVQPRRRTSFTACRQASGTLCSKPGSPCCRARLDTARAPGGLPLA